MKALLIAIPLILCSVQDTTRVDTTQKDIKLFFDQRTNEQVAKDINLKLDALILKLESVKKDTIQ